MGDARDRRRWAEMGAPVIGPADDGGFPDASECQNCGRVWGEDDLRPVRDLLERVGAGEPMPSGECPDCGSLCQPID